MGIYSERDLHVFLFSVGRTDLRTLFLQRVHRHYRGAVQRRQ